MKNDFAHTCAFVVYSHTWIFCAHGESRGSLSGGVDWLCSQNLKLDEEYCQELDFSACPQDWITKVEVSVLLACCLLAMAMIQDGTRCAPSPDALGVCVEAADIGS